MRMADAGKVDVAPTSGHKTRFDEKRLMKILQAAERQEQEVKALRLGVGSAHKN
jgi:hypothetical protein